MTFAGNLSLESRASTRGSLSCGPREVAPPQHFKRRLEGALLGASFGLGERAFLPPPRSAAAKLGVRFEAKVVKSLSSTYGNRFVSGLPFFFQTCSTRGRAIPDGLLFAQTSRSLVLIEVKLRHSTDAWHQLERFYLPIVSEALWPFRVSCLEICRYYDPSVRLPKKVAFVASAEEALETRECFHPVLIWDTRSGKGDA